jgi:hypothetical protein
MKNLILVISFVFGIQASVFSQNKINTDDLIGYWKPDIESAQVFFWKDINGKLQLQEISGSSGEPIDIISLRIKDDSIIARTIFIPNHWVTEGRFTFRDKNTLELILKPALESNSFLVTGGASGPDKFAENFWRVNQAGFQIFLADWERYGKQAGMLRNNEMIKSGIDQVYAFWDGQSKGTKNSIDLGKSYGAEVIIHEFSN